MIFTDYYTPSPIFRLVAQVRALYEEENAGGASAQYSEYLSALMYLGFSARNFIEEMAVPYWFSWKKVDYLCIIHNQRVGVSVKRAVNKEIMLQLKTNNNPPKSSKQVTDQSFEPTHFLDSAIRGLVVARNCVSPDHNFDRSILHVWCPTQRIATILRKAFKELNHTDLDVQGYLIIHLTVCYDPMLYLGHYKSVI